MLKRMIFPLLLGLCGGGILLALGNWQVQRMGWKRHVLAQIHTQIIRPPVPLGPISPKRAHQKYLSVTISGTLAGGRLRVLTSRGDFGPGFRIIARLDSDNGPLLVDLGFVPDGRKTPTLPKGKIRVIGNILWPEETDKYTPAPNAAEDMWFARDVPKMAATLGSLKMMVVARRIDPEIPGIYPWPLDGADIPNNHFQYAITWFSLAALWLGMTGYWLWRIRQRLD